MITATQAHCRQYGPVSFGKPIFAHRDRFAGLGEHVVGGRVGAQAMCFDEGGQLVEYSYVLGLVILSLSTWHPYRMGELSLRARLLVLVANHNLAPVTPTPGCGAQPPILRSG